jgi:hypothetical protein
MLICLCLNGNWSDCRVLSDERERTTVQELQLACLNTLHAGGVFPQNSFIDCGILLSCLMCFEGNIFLKEERIHSVL